MIKWIKKLLGFQVHVKWGEFRAEHVCWTRKEAIDWMRQYPIDTRVWITHSLGSAFVASRQFIQGER